MSTAYFKRFRMEIDLYDAPPVASLPNSYVWVPWDNSLLVPHAEVKYYSFLDEVDASVFTSLASRQGCYSLMNEICQKPGFIPGATWLVACAAGYVATVQGVRDRCGLGAIQNLGVMPCHRGKGIGSALLLRALSGFRQAGLGRVYLEVTAENDAAVRLYRRLGFYCRKTMYKAVEVMVP